MEQPQGSQPTSSNGDSTSRRPQPPWWILPLIIVVLVGFLLMRMGPERSEVPYSFFLEQLAKNNIQYVELSDTTAVGVFKEAPEAPATFNAKGELVQPRTDAQGKPVKLKKQFRVNLPRNNSDELGRLTALLQEKNVTYAVTPPDNSMLLLYGLIWAAPLILALLIWLSFRRTRDQLLGGGFLSGFTKSPARRYEASRQRVTFDDVAGLEGVKADLQEIVDYLKNPQKFQRLGGRVPKGVLLNGPPGTGKTLLARAVAGEAGVPFFSVSGSEFIQMFVGVGASRVRDLFRTAKEVAPSIIFIDEIDAVGRQRGAGLGGGHDEREQTLNQILSEMDGFTPADSVIVMAATNRPDVLDPALLRPGRFDRHITVGRPTQKGRLEIFKVHVRDVPLADDVDLEKLAASTIGLTGADIRNIVNEAALWAARQDKSRVDMSDFEYALDKVLMGALREDVLTDKEKERTAYHEAGHALTAWKLPGAHRVHKVSIIPRGRALGVTHIVPIDERLNRSQRELLDQLVVGLGGRAAEKLVYQETSVGAEDDLERVTRLARHMVAHWGMSERLGPVSYKITEDDPFLGREIHQQRQFSEHTMELIDEEVARILSEADQRATELLRTYRDQLDRLARALVDEEELEESEIEAILGPPAQSGTIASSAPDSDGRPASKPAASPAPRKQEQP
ncbi:MAG: ATP-dependent zinc metalloprotease FtsH 1 [Pirellulaceae bacterium]|nr:MAG: ATP-dependent zinc metalloprotease FtsH 1 [Pirellulaceae bacterium]